MGRVTCIVIGDPHFKTSNVTESQKLIDKVCSAVDKFRPDFVVCLGDLLDKHETAHETPYNLACKFMKELSDRCLTFLIVGNHDYCVSGDTSVLMWDGTYKCASDIKIDDELVGDDLKKRTVREIRNV